MFISLTRIENQKQIRCTIAMADIRMIDDEIEQTDNYTKQHAKSSIRTYSNNHPIAVVETQEQVQDALRIAGMLLKINRKTSELD